MGTAAIVAAVVAAIVAGQLVVMRSCFRADTLSLGRHLLRVGHGGGPAPKNRQ